MRVVLTLIALAWLNACAAADAPTSGPLRDDDFWRLATTLSEPAGTFEHADNLVSNEALFAQLAQRLRPRGGAYVGVGPEQNFSYIARLRPAIAFILDIREENRHLHLMYKALFEISADRADFLSRLFSRVRPPRLTTRTSVGDLFAAYDAAAASPALREQTIGSMRAHLLDARRLPLSPADLASIEELHRTFFLEGPDIRYGRSLPPDRARPPYRRLMTSTDLNGEPRSYLANEDAFASVKALQTQNLIVPVVGNFAGAHALRRIGDVVRQHGQLVSAFYASNVEVYLTRDERRTFCASLAALPRDDETTFISGARVQTLASKLAACDRIAPSLHWP